MLVDWHTVEKLSRISTYDIDKDRLMVLDKSNGEFEIEEYELILSNLKENILDPITMGFNYGQEDIKRHLRKLR